MMDRQKAIELLEEVRASDDGLYAQSQWYQDALDIAIDSLKNDAPVVHAHWVVNQRDPHRSRRCSRCRGYGNDAVTHDMLGDYNGYPVSAYEFCPHCGAIMDEEEDG